MAIHLRRREVIIGLGGTAAVWPIGSAAQQPIKKIRSLGLLLPGLPEASTGTATRDHTIRLSWQAAKKHKLTAFYEYQKAFQGDPFMTGITAPGSARSMP